MEEGTDLNKGDSTKNYLPKSLHFSTHKTSAWRGLPPQVFSEWSRLS